MAWVALTGALTAAAARQESLGAAAAAQALPECPPKGLSRLRPRRTARCNAWPPTAETSEKRCSVRVRRANRIRRHRAAWYARAVADFDEREASLLRANVAAETRASKGKGAAKNWARADEIRDALQAAGIVLEDTASGVHWHRS